MPTANIYERDASYFTTNDDRYIPLNIAHFFGDCGQRCVELRLSRELKPTKTKRYRVWWAVHGHGGWGKSFATEAEAVALYEAKKAKLTEWLRAGELAA